jgi:di/tricarboxylate transporter
VLEALDHLQTPLLAVKVQVLFLVLLRLQVAEVAAHITVPLPLQVALAAAVHGKDHLAIIAVVLVQQGKEILAELLCLGEIFKVVLGVGALVLLV